jgi:hypothetical protein
MAKVITMSPLPMLINYLHTKTECIDRLIEYIKHKLTLIVNDSDISLF